MNEKRIGQAIAKERIARRNRQRTLGHGRNHRRYKHQTDNSSKQFVHSCQMATSGQYYSIYYNCKLSP